MSYFFKINGHDYSMYVNKLIVGTEHTYTAKTSAYGYDQINYKYSKRTLEVGIIPLDDAAMTSLLTDVNKFKVTISYRDPTTNTMVENLPCVIPNNLIEYYTIQAGNVKYKAFSLQIKEYKTKGGAV